MASNDAQVVAVTGEVPNVVARRQEPDRDAAKRRASVHPIEPVRKNQIAPALHFVRSDVISRALRKIQDVDMTSVAVKVGCRAGR